MNQISLAALNNAHLYQAVCDAHQCRTEITDSLLLCIDNPPRLYSQPVTVNENAGTEVSERVTGGFKDSFHDIAPNPDKYFLFTAQ